MAAPFSNTHPLEKCYKRQSKNLHTDYQNRSDIIAIFLSELNSFGGMLEKYIEA